MMQDFKGARSMNSRRILPQKGLPRIVGSGKTGSMLIGSISVWILASRFPSVVSVPVGATGDQNHIHQNIHNGNVVALPESSGNTEERPESLGEKQSGDSNGSDLNLDTQTLRAMFEKFIPGAEDVSFSPQAAPEIVPNRDGFTLADWEVLHQGGRLPYGSSNHDSNQNGHHIHASESGPASGSNRCNSDDECESAADKRLASVERKRDAWLATVDEAHKPQYDHKGRLQRAVSGPGADPTLIGEFITWFGQFLREYRIRTMVEASCGHWPSGWQPYVDWPAYRPDGLEIYGVDLLAEGVADNNRYLEAAKQNQTLAVNCRKCNLWKRLLGPVELLVNSTASTEHANYNSRAQYQSSGDAPVNSANKALRLSFHQGDMLQSSILPSRKDLLLVKHTLIHLPMFAISKFLRAHLVETITNLGEVQENNHVGNAVEGLPRGKRRKCRPKFKYILFVNDLCRTSHCNRPHTKELGQFLFTPIDLDRSPFKAVIWGEEKGSEEAEDKDPTNGAEIANDAEITAVTDAQITAGDKDQKMQRGIMQACGWVRDEHVVMKRVFGYASWLPNGAVSWHEAVLMDFSMVW